MMGPSPYSGDCSPRTTSVACSTKSSSAVRRTLPRPARVDPDLRTRPLPRPGCSGLRRRLDATIHAGTARSAKCGVRSGRRPHRHRARAGYSLGLAVADHRASGKRARSALRPRNASTPCAAIFNLPDEMMRITDGTFKCPSARHCLIADDPMRLHEARCRSPPAAITRLTPKDARRATWMHILVDNDLAQASAIKSLVSDAKSRSPAAQSRMPFGVSSMRYAGRYSAARVAGCTAMSA